MKRLRKKPEILAPAGSIESLRGAIAAGADAVYIGGSRFGARAYADNPETDTLLEAIDYVHSKNVRIYLTVNTLLKEQELTNELYPFLEKYYRAGIDAAIVQDVGVLHFLAAQFPELPVHASTQMTLVSADGAKQLAGYPVTRIVPARELSLNELKELRRDTPYELECFVHGALCYCYSGQCLFSSMIGGRSGNRGRCAQPCRMPYTVLEENKKAAGGIYALSPKDLCTLDRIPDLVGAGIDSFKIEGRMKRPEYTAGVTAAYRLLTDLYFEYGEEEFYPYIKKHPEILSEQMERMSDLYNRGEFTKGYYVQYHGADMMSMERPNHTGTKVGEVAATGKNRVEIRLEKELNPQDVLEIRGVRDSYEFTVGKTALEEKTGCYQTNIKKGFLAEIGQPVYRTKNESLLSKLKAEYVECEKKLPVHAVFRAVPGEAAELTLWIFAHKKSSLVPGADESEFRQVSVTVTGDIVAVAENQPVTEEKIAAQLKKTGESGFFFETLDIITEGAVFLPVGKIKELRRQALEALKTEVLNGYRRSLPEPEQNVEKNIPAEESTHTAEHKLMDEPAGLAERPVLLQQPELIALVSTGQQCEAVLKRPEITTVYVDVLEEGSGSLTLCETIKKAGKRAFLALPHVFRTKEKTRYLALLPEMTKERLDGFLVRSLEELTFLEENSFTDCFDLRLNYNLYTMQQEAKQFFKEKGYRRFTVPVELKEEEIRSLGVEDSDFIIYGRLSLMVSAQCVRDNVLTCTHGKKTTAVVLKDRMGAEFPVRQVCSCCYNVIYNSACVSLLGTDVKHNFAPAGWRLDFTLETPSEVEEILEAFLEDKPCPGKGPFTKGHFKRGIL